jgi:signal-transduction protein with cAMP-binding, CBS, and nucleotidyltransferase domain
MSEVSYIAVKDVMTANPVIIDGLATVAQAVDLIRDKGFSSLVIDKRHEGDEYGLLTIHEIAKEIIANDRAPERVSVYEIMVKPAMTVDAEMNIKYAVRLLMRFRLSRALVLDHGKVAGIVTLRDLTLRSIESIA